MDPLGILGTIRDIREIIRDISDAVSRYRNAPKFAADAVVEVGCYFDIMEEIESEIQAAKIPNHRLRSISVLAKSVLQVLEEVKDEVRGINPDSRGFRIKSALTGVHGRIRASLQELGYKTTLIVAATGSFSRQSLMNRVSNVESMLNQLSRGQASCYSIERSLQPILARLTVIEGKVDNNSQWLESIEGKVDDNSRRLGNVEIGLQQLTSLLHATLAPGAGISSPPPYSTRPTPTQQVPGPTNLDFKLYFRSRFERMGIRFREDGSMDERTVAFVALRSSSALLNALVDTIQQAERLTGAVISFAERLQVLRLALRLYAINAEILQKHPLVELFWNAEFGTDNIPDNTMEKWVGPDTALRNVLELGRKLGLIDQRIEEQYDGDGRVIFGWCKQIEQCGIFSYKGFRNLGIV